MLELHSPHLTTPQDFMDYLLKEGRPNRDLELIKKAAEFAFDSHIDQKRKSGEPYILHPFAVAVIVDQMKLDTASICGALMHDVLEDCEVTKEELTQKFGDTIYQLVDGVTKLSKIKFGTKAELQAESLRKMLLAMTRDIRVIIIKVCDRLHNMRTMEHMPAHKQVRISQETLDIYCPLANRLGMSSIKWQLEDLCLKYSKPKVFYDILKRIAQKRKEREGFIENVINELKETLKETNFQVEITGRPKSFYSIYLKSLKSPKYLDDMFDLVGLRILTQSKEQCYGILGVVHSMWTPLQNRFKDYIAVPKTNLYQSLHTTIFHPKGQRVEVQIRTFEMHETSEFGVAAHSHYKTGSTKALKSQEELKWLREIVEWHSDIRDSQEFIENVKLDLFQHMVYAFTPNGKIIELREGSTPIDFAFYIHTEVGYKCVGAKLEDKVVPLNYQIQNGDIISIITSNNNKGPARGWLEIVKTKKAREAILSFLRKSSKDDFIFQGAKTIQNSLEERIKRLPQEKKVSWREIINSNEFSEISLAYGFRDICYLQEAIGKGEFRFEGLANHLQIFQVEVDVDESIEQLSKKKSKSKKSRDTILVAGCPDMLVRISKCCNPLFGDDISGFITRGRGVSVHRSDCPNSVILIKEEPERQLDVQWDPRALMAKDTYFQTEVEIVSQNKSEVLAKITSIISKFKINILSMNGRTKKEYGVLTLVFQVKNVGQLNNLITAIQDVEEVISIHRKEPSVKKKK
ncbi:MAG: hypothetical protein COB02_09740 [Candidatus Cloacimonadota bacterium]|nr:MAG: hypothetical protein COB02_09740 [Candidatus Cloacimonadota bacterium]